MRESSKRGGVHFFYINELDGDCPGRVPCGETGIVELEGVVWKEIIGDACGRSSRENSAWHERA